MAGLLIVVAALGYLAKGAAGAGVEDMDVVAGLDEGPRTGHRPVPPVTVTSGAAGGLSPSAMLDSARQHCPVRLEA